MASRVSVLRGGSWYGRYAEFCRSARRFWNLSDGCFGSGGFRVVCVPRPSRVKEGGKGEKVNGR